MLRLWVLVCAGILVGCARAPSALLVGERRPTVEERKEIRGLIDALIKTDYRRDFVGKPTGDFPRLFSLAEEIHDIKDGRRAYSYRMHETGTSYDGMTNFWVITDGGRSSSTSPETAARCETILDVGWFVACN